MCLANSYLVGRGKDRILVDTGNGDAEYIQAFQSIQSTHDLTISKILVTHLHPAHAGGLDPLSRLAWVSSPTIMKHGHSPRGFPNLTSIKYTPLTDGITIQTPDGETTLKALYTPGHTRDSIVFHLSEEDAIITGDTLVPHDSATSVVLEDPVAYLASLRRLDAMFPKLAYPGHGDVVVPATDLIKRSIKDQMELPGRIIEALRSGSGVMDARDMVRRLVTDVPEEARRNFTGTVLQHLLELEKRGKVRKRSAPKIAPSAAYEERDPDRIKGPGGLTLAQVSKLVKESRAKDDKVYGLKPAEKRQEKGKDFTGAESGRSGKSEQSEVVRLHPAHRELEALVEVVWSVV